MLDSGSSQYLSRTFGAPTDNTSFTLSFWQKRGKQVASYDAIFGASDVTGAIYLKADALCLYKNADVGVSSALMRDFTAWQHVCIISNGTTVKGYLNNVEIVSYTGTMSGINSAVGHWVGVRPVSPSASFLYSYLSNIHFIDGQALTPSSFGRTSADTLQWVNKTYAGTYGNNGFKLDFANSADLGNDVSGNNNDWTLNGGITSANQYTDTPTNNYCVLSQINSAVAAKGTITKGNLKLVSSDGIALGTFAIPKSGKWVWEGTLSTLGVPDYGIATYTKTGRGNATGTYGAYCNGGNGLAFYNGSNSAADGRQAVSAGDIGVVAVDVDSNKLWIGRNRSGTVTWMGNGDPVAGTSPSFSAGGGGGVYSTAMNLASADWFPEFGAFSGDTWAANLGQQPLATTLTGFLALCTANIPTPTIIDPSDHFYAKTRAGTGAAFNVTGIPFAPELVESKSRSAATDWARYDSVRGVQKQLESNTTSAETTEATGLTAFNADGFSGGALAQLNTNAATYIDYMWKLGGAAVSNTNGSITSSVSANTLAGQSVVTWVAPAGTSATIGHGLTSVPQLIIAMDRTSNGATAWPVYHKDLTAAWVLYLMSTAAKANDTNVWNATTPTSSVFTVGNWAGINTLNHNMVAHCFHSVEGYSKVFSYTGNGSADGPFVNCGFKPRYILIKRSDSTDNWLVWDTQRMPYNISSLQAYANGAAAEVDVGSASGWDQTSTGFKPRSNNSVFNTTSATYVGIAFAEAPTKYATAR
jgi:hypothetical protein